MRDANDRALALLDLTAPRTVLEIGFGQGRTAAVLLAAGHHTVDSAGYQLHLFAAHLANDAGIA